MAADLGERVGPVLSVVSGIDSASDPDEVRGSLIAFLDDLAAGLPGDLRLAFGAALALRDDTRHRFLEERMEWLAARLQRDVRTARRRVKEAITRVEAAASAPPESTDGFQLGDWYLARLSTVLHLDGARTTAIEERTVVAAREGLADIVIPLGIPRPAGAVASKQSVELTILRGGALAASEWLTPTYFRYSIGLPRPLRRGEAHDIRVALAIPPDQPFAPHYAFQPLRRCDEFDLRVRFGAAGRAKRVWCLAGLPVSMVEGFSDPAALIPPDAAGDVDVRFKRLRTGLTYGARWSD